MNTEQLVLFHLFFTTIFRGKYYPHITRDERKLSFCKKFSSTHMASSGSIGIPILVTLVLLSSFIP